MEYLLTELGFVLCFVLLTVSSLRAKVLLGPGCGPGFRNSDPGGRRPRNTYTSTARPYQRTRYPEEVSQRFMHTDPNRRPLSGQQDPKRALRPSEDETCGRGWLYSSLCLRTRPAPHRLCAEATAEIASQTCRNKGLRNVNRGAEHGKSLMCGRMN